MYNLWLNFSSNVYALSLRESTSSVNADTNELISINEN